MTSSQIEQMFEWEFVKKIEVSVFVAKLAVGLARDYGLKPADSIHAASALVKKVDALQCWDRDFGKVSHLIPVEEPKMISVRPPLLAALAEAEKSIALRLEGSKNDETGELGWNALEPGTTDLSGARLRLTSGQALAAPGEGATELEVIEKGSEDGQPKERGF